MSRTWRRSAAGERGQRSRDFRSMAVATAAEASSRGLSFVYYLVAARVLAPEGFGVLRYTITIALLAFGLTQVLVTAVGRELGAARGDEDRIGAVLGSSLLVGSVLWLGSLAVCVGVHVAGLVDATNLAGLLAVLSGFTFFQLYYAISWGLGQVPRMAATYAGGGLVQLLTFVAIARFTDPSALVALVIFGASGLVPIAICELVRPVVVNRRLTVNRDILRALWALCAPLVVAQAAYVVWNSADQIWVQHRFGTAQTGLYGAARNLSQIFVVIPGGICAILIPKVAQLRARGDDEQAVRLIKASVGIALTLSALLAAGLIALRDPILDHLYGAPYTAAAPSLVGLSVAMTLYAAFTTVTQSMIGWGKPSVYTVAIVCAALSEAVYLFAFDAGRPSSAAWALAASIGSGLLLATGWLLIRRPARADARPPLRRRTLSHADRSSSGGAHR